MYFIRHFFLISFIFLGACKSSAVNQKMLITVAPQSTTNTLFFSGTIQPLSTTVITSPVDGVVIDMPFQYGGKVKAGDILFTFSSPKFLQDYKAALMQYVKAKSDFNASKGQLTEGAFLHRNQLISDDDFKSKQTNYYAVQLALFQAKDNLENLFQQINMKKLDLEQLNIANIDKMIEASHLQSETNHLKIISPAAGLFLSAAKAQDENKKIIIGDPFKQGEVLGVIGDMQGIRVRIKVNEMTVNQLKLGQKVKITGIAFPDEVLLGKIKQIDRQGEQANSGMPNFSVEVIVPLLTEKQRDNIHVGMSAKVEIDIEEPLQIMIPLKAIIEKNGFSYVELLDKTTQKMHLVLIQTGKTTMDEVVILSGIKAGDQIIAAH